MAESTDGVVVPHLAPGIDDRMPSNYRVGLHYGPRQDYRPFLYACFLRNGRCRMNNRGPRETSFKPLGDVTSSDVGADSYHRSHVRLFDSQVVGSTQVGQAEYSTMGVRIRRPKNRPPSSLTGIYYDLPVAPSSDHYNLQRLIPPLLIDCTLRTRRVTSASTP